MPPHGLSRDKPSKSIEMDVQSFAVHLFSSKHKRCLMFPPAPDEVGQQFHEERQQARVLVRVRRFQYSTSTSEDRLWLFDKVITVFNRKSPKYSRVIVRFSEGEGLKPQRLRYIYDQRRPHRHPFLVGSTVRGLRKVMFLRPLIRSGYLCILRGQRIQCFIEI
jgi:hypothetical protein